MALPYASATSGDKALGELTQDRVKTLFDYNDGQLVNRSGRKWVRAGTVAGCKRSNGYVVTKIDQRIYYVHRLIFLWHHGYMPDEIDHVNRTPSDNRIENLRAVTRSQNQWNRDASGVYFKRGKWETSIQSFGSSQYLGQYETREEAREVYLQAKEDREKMLPAPEKDDG